MDSSLEMQALPQHDQLDATDLLKHLPQQRSLPARGQQPQQQGQLASNARSPAPPPSSIFVPPSAVPACEYSVGRVALWMQHFNHRMTLTCCLHDAVGTLSALLI
jgi:hypothetical protein